MTSAAESANQSAKQVAAERAGQDRGAGRHPRLRRHPPADRLAGPAGRVRPGQRAGRPARRLPGAGRAAVRAGAAVGAGGRVRRGRAVAAGAGDLGLQLRVRPTRNAPQAGGQRRQGRDLRRAGRAGRADRGRRWRRAAAAAGHRGACSGCPAASSWSARSGSASWSPAGRRSMQAGGRGSCDDMDLPSDQHARRVAERTGQVGFIAKGLATALIGMLVVIAAMPVRPERGVRPGRGAQVAGQPAVRALPADRGRAGAGLLRRLLLLRRPLPPRLGRAQLSDWLSTTLAGTRSSAKTSSR